jgi:hypothetical protein
MAATAAPDEPRPMITDNVVLSNDGGRWSVSLDGRARREHAPGGFPTADREPVPAR